MSTTEPKFPQKKGHSRQRRDQLRPYAQALAVPFRTIWADPLGRPGAVVFSLIVLMAVFAPVLATHDPNVMNERTVGLVAPFVNGEWGAMSITGSTPINGLTWLEDGRAMAVGVGGAILEYANRSWQPMDSPTQETLRAIAGHAPGLVFAVGDQGTILRYDGRGWSELPAPNNADLRGVATMQTDDALIVGDRGTVLHWDGQQVQELESGTSNNLRAVSISPSGQAVLVGDRGTIIHYVDGTFHSPTFRSFLDSTFRTLNAVHLLSDHVGFAVGERGTIMGFDGTNWFGMTSPESRELRDVSVLSADEAYVVGIRGIVLSFVDGDWTRLPLGYQRDFRGVSIHKAQGFAFGTDPYIDELAPPSRDHLFGTTHLGRDIWSQVMYGSRTALLVGVVAAIVVNLIGVTVGLTAGYYRGQVDTVLMRIVDIMYGLPLEPFAIILVLMFKPSVWIIILAISLLTWRTNARIIRSQVLSIVERPFIKAARVAGASHSRIMLVHIAPNILPLAFLQLAVAIGYAITAEATLSFLGLGPPQMHSWGTILHAARLSGAWRTAWWWVLPPGVFISITVVSVFLISRSLEVLTNPRLRGGNNRAPKRP